MNIHTRKNAICAAVLSIIVILSGLSAAGCSEQNPESVLYRRGMSIVRTICEISSSDGYLKNLYGILDTDSLDRQLDGGTTCRELLSESHYQSADAVFMIEATVRLSEETVAENVPESLQKAVSLQEKEAVASALCMSGIPYYEASPGLTSLALMLTATELFVCDGVREDSVISYLYVFRDGFPMMVTFRSGRDGAVQGVGRVLFDRELNLTSEEELQAYLGKAYSQLHDVTVRKVH